MWIAESTSSNRIYCLKKTESEVHGWLHRHFPIGQSREIYWTKKQLCPTFEKPPEWTEWIKKEMNMALPEPLMVRKLSPQEEDQLRGVILMSDHSFFDK